jgi:hypothetical protein
MVSKCCSLKKRESRRSNFEPMVGREREAVWQLKHIAKKLTGIL